MALAFGVTAAVHAARGLAPDAGDPSPPARHAAFVLINLAAAVGVVRRPRWFPAPFALLVIQQLASHGGRAWAAWRAGATPGAEDVLVAAFMPVALGLLLLDLRRAPPAPLRTP